MNIYDTLILGVEYLCNLISPNYLSAEIVYKNNTFQHHPPSATYHCSMAGVFHIKGSSPAIHAFPIHLPVGERYIRYSNESSYHEENDAIDKRFSLVSARQECHVRYQIGEIPGPQKS
jgi:hypothetical protein